MRSDPATIHRHDPVNFQMEDLQVEEFRPLKRRRKTASALKVKSRQMRHTIKISSPEESEMTSSLLCRESKFGGR